jgi:hypothetical protein
MKTRWLLTLAGWVLGTGAALAQVQVFQGPAPSQAVELPGVASPPYQPMPRGTAEPTIMPYPPQFGDGPGAGNYGAYGTDCSWEGRGATGSFYGGVGVSWLMPVLQRNPAFLRANNVGGVNFIGTSDYTWDLRTSPTAFLGYRTADGLGIRGRWWEFNQNAMEAERANGDVLASSRPLNLGIIAPLDGGIFAESGLSLTVFDLELTHDTTLAGWALTVGLGARYVHTHQEHNVFTTNANSTLAASILSSHNFNGGGPTLSLGARHTVFGGLVLYGLGRGSVLFGPAEQTAYQANAAGALVAYRIQNQTTVLPIVELEAGVEWGMQMGRGRVFVQTGFVGQTWFGAGSASRSTGFDTFDQSDSNLGLVGFTIRTGVQY